MFVCIAPHIPQNSACKVGNRKCDHDKTKVKNDDQKDPRTEFCDCVFPVYMLSGAHFYHVHPLGTDFNLVLRGIGPQKTPGH